MNLNLFCRFHFGYESSELVELFPLPYSFGKSNSYFHDFYVFIRRCYEDVSANGFFPRFSCLRFLVDAISSSG